MASISASMVSPVGTTWCPAVVSSKWKGDAWSRSQSGLMSPRRCWAPLSLIDGTFRFRLAAASERGVCSVGLIASIFTTSFANVFPPTFSVCARCSFLGVQFCGATLLSREEEGRETSLFDRAWRMSLLSLVQSFPSCCARPIVRMQRTLRALELNLRQLMRKLLVRARAGGMLKEAPTSSVLSCLVKAIPWSAGDGGWVGEAEERWER